VDKSALSSDLSLVRQKRVDRATASTSQSEIKALAELAMAACDGLACMIQWKSPASHGTSTATTASFSNSALDTVIALVERRLRQAGRSDQSIYLRAGEIAAHLNGEATAPIEAAVLVSSDADMRIVSVAVAALGRSPNQMRAAAQLANEAVGKHLRELSTEESNEFWRARSSSNAERLTELTRHHEAAAAEQALIEATVAACSKVSARNRFAGLGAALAGTGPFDTWMVAIGPPEALQIVASSTPSGPRTGLKGAGVIADAIRRSTTVTGRTERTGIGKSAEDQAFAPYAAYICVPFVGGAIALAARREIAHGEQHRLEELVRWLNPIIEKWLLEDELNRLQQLVRTLGVRLFTAIDHERQRIALESDPSEARSILKQLDEVLRMRIRELRPATLGRSNLLEALGHEIRRLSDAGIKARIVHPEKAKKLGRPIQQLCYQLVREALSNVIRHAEATRVTIAITKRDGLARIVIDDNGKGFHVRKGSAATSRHTSGSGLVGMAERVELMGGKVSFERIDKITRLTAEIPEL